MINFLLNADDFGISSAVNESINRCFQQHLLQKTSIMVNMPCSEAATNIAFKNGFDKKVGLHINLTEGYPLTDAIKSTLFCDEYGKFTSNGRKTINRIFLDSEVKDAVGKEVEAQCKKYIDCGFTLLHCDSHQHIHTSISLVNIIISILEEYNFQSVRICRNIPINQIRGLKKSYKEIVNKKLGYFNSTHNNNNMAFEYFGSMTDAEQSIGEYRLSGKRIEVMTHPGIITNGQIIDILNNKNLTLWCKKYDKNIIFGDSDYEKL